MSSVLFDALIGLFQVLTFQVKMDQGEMAMKEYSTLTQISKAKTPLSDSLVS